MITTIQLDTKVKTALDKMKKPRETYEDVIARMIKGIQLKQDEALMKEGYLEMAQESLSIAREWGEIDDVWE